MTLWLTILAVVYMGGAWATIEGGFERMIEVQCDMVVGRPIHPMSMLLYRLFYYVPLQVILTGLLWPIAMLIGVGIFLYFYRKNKRRCS